MGAGRFVSADNIRNEPSVTTVFGRSFRIEIVARIRGDGDQPKAMTAQKTMPSRVALTSGAKMRGGRSSPR